MTGPVVADIELWVGADQNITITVRNGAGALVNLTGVTAVWELLTPQGDAAWLKKQTGGLGIVIENQTLKEGQLTVSLAAADLETFEAGMYYHVCRVTKSSKVRPVTVGNVTLKRSGV